MKNVLLLLAIFLFINVSAQTKKPVQKKSKRTELKKECCEEKKECAKDEEDCCASASKEQKNK